MRLEQRDWSESPVRVWVNTFKVFLDEYMNEFKTLDCIPTKVNMICLIFKRIPLRILFKSLFGTVFDICKTHYREHVNLALL